MISAPCWRRATPLVAMLPLASLLFFADCPAHAAELVLKEGGEVATVAKTTVKRSGRRGRRPAARRSSARPAEATAVPIPRPRPESAAASETSSAAAGAPESAVPEPAPSAAPGSARPAPDKLALPKNPAAAKAELRALYAVNALSYRCNFELTTREGAVLDRAVTALENQLKLDTQQADALFSDVDLTLYGNGGNGICQKTGSEAKSFRATLDRLLGE